MQVQIDPLTRNFHLTYPVPKEAPDEVIVLCTWSPAGRGDWRPARVTPFLSDTALRLAREPEWRLWTEQGRITERRAAGLPRTAIFHPYPEAQPDGMVDVDFRIAVQTPDGRTLWRGETRLQADNRDVVYLEDWTKVLQRDAVAPGEAAREGAWTFRTGQPTSAGVTFGNALYGRPGRSSLRPLTYPLRLSGFYAIFVCTRPGDGTILLRLTGDERADRVASRLPGQEALWAWRRMDHQHLVLKPPQSYTGDTPAHIDYVKLVPLSAEQAERLEAPFAGRRDRLLIGYYEPYSWSFYTRVQETLQHREPLAAFAEAGVQVVDMQLSRFGAKAFYESRITDQLLYATIGDPEPGDPNPRTDNVGRMQQYTNTLQSGLRYTRELGLGLHANFGASAAYPGTPLQSEITRRNPHWLRGSALKFELPEVQEYVLSIYREALELGANGLSIDFCRYPECIDAAETANTMLRRLRRLADTFGEKRKRHIPILARFPAKGVRLWDRFDYRAWAREGLVDYLCPSNIQGRHIHFDIHPYVEAVRGARCKLLPCVDGLDWGPEMPGLFLWRVRQLYDAGVDGIYVYQADARVLGAPDDRRCMRLLGSRSAVRRWWEEEARLRPARSKGIYLTFPSSPDPFYHGWQRLRVWLEGVRMGEVEMYLDGRLVCQYDGPPYVLGREEYESEGVIPPGEHELRVRAQDGDGWLEQRFMIRGAG